MTPGPYFHIGGDESHVTKKDDYVYFIERVAPIVRKYGKRVIGWDEVANATLDSSVVAQFWADEDNARKAVAQGMKVLLSPARKAYLDMQYDTLSEYGFAGLLRELRTMVAESEPTAALFRTNHASNYLPVQGELPRDRDRIVAAIGAALDGQIALRPELFRGL